MAESSATTRVFTDAQGQINIWLRQCAIQSRLDYAGGVRLHTPCVTGIYKGIWPDDFLWPLLADPSLADGATLTRALAFITESIIDLPRVPDRIEPDGMPVMQPGGLSSPHARHMPLHLPAAWVRLIDCLQRMGAAIPRKPEWARLIARSFEEVPFSCGLAYNDPQRPGVGFGFHDPCAITGFELMSSLVLHRGFQRAAELFADVAKPAQTRHWISQSEDIRANLYRLWSEEEGAYLAGSKDCRQVNVWANGLAYWLTDAEKKKRIVAWYRAHREEIFLSGYTRQIAEKDGWQRQLVAIPVGTYTNGGYWSTGTGFVLPAIADQDADFAAAIAGQLAGTMEKTSFAEWISVSQESDQESDQESGGAKGFLAGMAMPAIGLMSILERKPLTAFF